MEQNQPSVLALSRWGAECDDEWRLGEANLLNRDWQFCHKPGQVRLIDALAYAMVILAGLNLQKPYPHPTPRARS